jgi:hypothetical protein
MTRYAAYDGGLSTSFQIPLRRSTRRLLDCWTRDPLPRCRYEYIDTRPMGAGSWITLPPKLASQVASTEGRHLVSQYHICIEC